VVTASTRSLPLADLPAWAHYADAPSGNTLGALVAAARASNRNEDVVPSLLTFLNGSGNWKAAQHLSLLCLRDDQLAYADYFSHRALELSGGDAFARITRARVLWERRLPLAVLHETSILRAQARRVRPRKRRRLLQAEIGELNVKAYCYVADLEHADPWILGVRRRGGATIECWVQLLFAARHADHLAHWELASFVLAPHFDKLGARPKAVVLRGLQYGLLRVLEARR